MKRRFWIRSGGSTCIPKNFAGTQRPKLPLLPNRSSPIETPLLVDFTFQSRTLIHPSRIFNIQYRTSLSNTFFPIITSRKPMITLCNTRCSPLQTTTSFRLIRSLAPIIVIERSHTSSLRPIHYGLISLRDFFKSPWLCLSASRHE